MPRTILHDLTNRYNANPQPYKKKATKGTQVSLSPAYERTLHSTRAEIAESAAPERRAKGVIMSILIGPFPPSLVFWAATGGRLDYLWRSRFLLLLPDLDQDVVSVVHGGVHMLL